MIIDSLVNSPKEDKMERRVIRVLEQEEVGRLETIEDWQSEFTDSDIVEMLRRYQDYQFNSRKYYQSDKGKESAKAYRTRKAEKVRVMEERLAELEALEQERAIGKA